MRIIAGEKRGFPLVAPEGRNTRPTLGRVRESVFSILGSDVIDAVTFDLFAGAGALGLEALSRGAASCAFVELAGPAVAALRTNIDKLGYAEQATLHSEDVLRWLARTEFPDHPALLLADPPYGKGLAVEILEMLAGKASLTPNSILVLQCGSREPIPEISGRLGRYRVQQYGPTAVHFFVLQSLHPDG